MASHLSTIGIRYDDLNSDDSMERALDEGLRNGREIPVRGGRYVLWEPGGGAELWLQVPDSEEFLGFIPHFSGPAHMTIAVTELFRDPDRWDCAVYGWASPQTDDPESGAYPFVVDLPAFRLVEDALSELPVVTAIQIAAFAHELHCFPSDDAFTDAQRRRSLGAWVRRLVRRKPDPVWAAESFMPTGLFDKSFGGQTDPDEPPQAMAMFAGHVLAADALTNPATGRGFYHLHVRTLGGEYDVVADPEIVNGEPTVGGVVQGLLWLSGRLVDLEPDF